VKLRRLVATALLVGMMQSATAESDGGRWLPIKRSELIQLLAGDSGVDAVKIETLQDFLATAPLTLSPERLRDLEGQKIELANNLAPDDAVWIASNESIQLSMAMAGRNDSIHTVRVYVPVVNYSYEQSDRVFGALSALFKTIYPDWSEAEEWPQKSLTNAWEMHPFLYKGPPLRDPNDVIIKKNIDGIISATFGVPPDLVFYTVTARPICVPRIDESNPLQRRDPMRRLIC
jgi:hypothetical protein